MLKIKDIHPAKGSAKKRKRVARGCGSGQGCTAGRGYNGEKSRSGSCTKLYYEGGQTPLTRRLPKRGFTNRFRVQYQIVKLSEIEKLAVSEKEITVQVLYSNGLIHSASEPVKVLGDGDIKKSLTIKANAFSESARQKIEKAKGKAEVITSV